MIKRIFHNPQAIIGLLIILSIFFIAIFAHILAPNNPDQVNVTNKYATASSEYPLGTDQLGRCEFSRLLYGARYSIGMSFPALILLALMGITIGTLSACIGGVFDHAVTILCNIFVAFPALIIAAAIIGLFGNSINNIVLSVVLSMWAWFVRMVRSYARTEMGKDYILASRIAGCTIRKTVFRHLVPNILPQFLVYMSTGISSAILTISSFSFIGFGLKSGTAEWGAMLNDARTGLYSHPELLVYPGLCIMLATFGFNLFGEALRDIVEPEVTDE